SSGNGWTELRAKMPATWADITAIAADPIETKREPGYRLGEGKLGGTGLTQPAPPGPLLDEGGRPVGPGGCGGPTLAKTDKKLSPDASIRIGQPGKTTSSETGASGSDTR